MVDLVDYVEAYMKLEDKSPQELVDLALEHIVDLPPLPDLILQELCSRVDPGWEKREPPASAPETSVQLTPACGSMNALGSPCDRPKGHSGLHDWEQP